MTLFPNNTTKQVVNNELNKKLKKFDERIENNSSEITSLKSRVSNTEDNITSINGDIEDIEEDIGSLDTRVDTVELALEEKQDTLNFDNSPIENSENPVKSGGIYDALETKLDKESVKFDPEPNGIDALSTGGAYDIVQDLSEQIHDVKDATVLQSTDEKQFVNEGSIVIDNSQEEVTNAIEVRNGDTKLKDTDVDGVLRTDKLNSLNNDGIEVEDTLNCDNVVANNYKGQTENSITITDQNGEEHTFNNYQDVVITGVESAKNDVNGDQIDTTYVKKSEKGIANGVASLDVNGKIPTSQLPMEALIYCGEWDASTGVFPTVGSGEEGALISGDFYNVAVGGTIDGVDYEVGDWIIYKIINNVGSWTLKENTSDVHSVNGKTGVVLLTPSDIGISII